MEEKKRQNGDDSSLDYEELLNGFAFEGDSGDVSTTTRGDLDGLALAELLGDEELKPEALHASGTFDSIAAEDYSSLARQFEELDLSVFAGEEPARSEPAPEQNPEEGFEPVEIESPLMDIAVRTDEAADDYATVLNSIELEDAPLISGSSESESESTMPFELDLEALAEEMPDFSDLDMTRPLAANDRVPAGNSFPAAEGLLSFEDIAAGNETDDMSPPSRRVLDIVNLADTEPFTGEPAPETVLPARTPEPAPVAEMKSNAFSLHDLLSEVEEPKTPAAGITRVEQVLSKAAALPTANEAEDDFLGLSVPAPAEGPRRRKDVTAEVLFEGVEMDFDRQVDAVTLAELYLAQGRKKEASDLFRHVSKEKGVTHWVAKRLRLLAAGSDK